MCAIALKYWEGKGKNRDMVAWRRVYIILLFSGIWYSYTKATQASREATYAVYEVQQKGKRLCELHLRNRVTITWEASYAWAGLNVVKF